MWLGRQDGFRNLLLGFWTSRFGDRKVMFKLPPRYTQKDVVLIKELMEAEQKIGNVVLAVSDG